MLGDLKNYYSGKLSLILPLAGTCIFMLLLNHYLKKLFDKQIDGLKKKNRIGSVKINKFFTLTGAINQCEGHTLSDFSCGNLECSYGKLRYLLDLLDNCKKSLDICIYSFNAKDFGEVIIKAYQRGVKVRIVTDADSSLGPSSVFRELRKHNMPIRQQMSNFIMHHKFAIIDGKILINGSMNWTLTSFFRNWESLIITSEPDLVLAFQQAFEDLWQEYAPERLYAYFQNKKEQIVRI